MKQLELIATSDDGKTTQSILISEIEGSLLDLKIVEKAIELLEAGLQRANKGKDI